MPTVIRVFAKATVLITLCFVGGLGLIIASNLLPLDGVKRNVLASVSTANYSQHLLFSGSRLDHWSECVSATVGMRSKTTETRESYGLRRALVDAVQSPMLGNCEQIASDQPYMQNYFRYWHGAQIIARPVLSFSSVPVLRALVLLAFSAAFVFFVTTVGSKIGWLTAGAIAAVVIASPLYSQLLLVPHASSWIIGFVVAAHIMRSRDVSLESNVQRFVLIGILVAYFDLLINPVVAPTLALIAVSLRRWHDRNDASFQEAIVLFTAWLAGYGGFWFLKWVAAASAMGAGTVVSTIVQVVSQRLSGSAESPESSVWESIGLNAAVMRPTMAVSVVVLVLSFLAIRRSRTGGNGRKEKTPVWKHSVQMLVIGLLPVLWLLVVRNHSIVHYWMVAPILTWSITSVILAAHLLVLSPRSSR